jgi:hypothetical protein
MIGCIAFCVIVFAEDRLFLLVTFGHFWSRKQRPGMRGLVAFSNYAIVCAGDVQFHSLRGGAPGGAPGLRPGGVCGGEVTFMYHFAMVVLSVCYNYVTP